MEPCICPEGTKPLFILTTVFNKCLLSEILVKPIVASYEQIFKFCGIEITFLI